MSDLDLRGLIAAATPQGPSEASDAGLVTTAPVYAVDVPGRRVQVAVHGTAMWLPAVAARYRIAADGTTTAQGTARVLLNATTGRPALVVGAVDPSDPAVLGTVTATATGTVTVTVYGTSYTLPAAPSTYTVGQTAWVLLSDWGVPVLVLGPSSLASSTQTAPTPPSSGGSAQASFTIGPQWSGTYRTGQGWDQWNTGRYGGRSDLYQGNAYGSGTLTGLATYGDQLVNLGATSLDQITLSARRNADGSSGSLTVQGTSAGSKPGGAPSGSGTSATTGTAGPGGWTSVDLPADVREALRTGAAKGLVAIGAGYGGWGGTATAGSMVLTGTYTRPA